MEVLYEREISPGEIAVSPRPVWKCRTCQFYGKRPSCPPHVPSWREARELVRSYEKALLIKFRVDMERFEEEKREVLLYLLRRERELFPENPYVLAVFPGRATSVRSASSRNLEIALCRRRSGHPWTR